MFSVKEIKKRVEETFNEWDFVSIDKEILKKELLKKLLEERK